MVRFRLLLALSTVFFAASIEAKLLSPIDETLYSQNDVQAVNEFLATSRELHKIYDQWIKSPTPELQIQYNAGLDKLKNISIRITDKKIKKEAENTIAYVVGWKRKDPRLSEGGQVRSPIVSLSKAQSLGVNPDLSEAEIQKLSEDNTNSEGSTWLFRSVDNLAKKMIHGVRIK